VIKIRIGKTQSAFSPSEGTQQSLYCGEDLDRFCHATGTNLPAAQPAGSRINKVYTIRSQLLNVPLNCGLGPHFTIHGGGEHHGTGGG
jgi:hypothetical protein